MGRYGLNKLVLGTVFLAIMGISTFAYAQWGRGAGDCSGYGARNCPGYNQLTEEERNQVDEAKDRFMAETEALRDQLYEKRTALGDELAKADPNVEAAAKMQTEISNLKAQLDQIRLSHQIEMKKINPDLGGKYGRMKGSGGRGGYGRGHCWR